MTQRRHSLRELMTLFRTSIRLGHTSDCSQDFMQENREKMRLGSLGLFIPEHRCTQVMHFLFVFWSSSLIVGHSEHSSRASSKHPMKASLSSWSGGPVRKNMSNAHHVKERLVELLRNSQKNIAEFQSNFSFHSKFISSNFLLKKFLYSELFYRICSLGIVGTLSQVFQIVAFLQSTTDKFCC